MKKAPLIDSELPTLSFARQADWEQWLDGHHVGTPGVWLKLGKTGSGVESVTYTQAVEVALCYGWIDGKKKALDGQHWLQKFTQRGSRSIWSRINREKALALIADGRMRPAGHHAVIAAQRDGRWQSAYDGQGNAAIPDDFQAALNASPAAKALFDTLDGRNRYAMLFRIQTVKRAETRARNITRFIQMLEKGEKIHS